MWLLLLHLPDRILASEVGAFGVDLHVAIKHVLAALVDGRRVCRLGADASVVDHSRPPISRCNSKATLEKKLTCQASRTRRPPSGPLLARRLPCSR